uniref:Uncharacterized protein n=1 Tax=Meloidogyne enterolobii TaxID=390850 RepID=A0A6V7XHJ9_MELEN|nr:unnamed protein product [Meloidogyne enterolobii]
MKYEHFYDAINIFWPNKWWETENQFNENIEGELLINGDFIPISVISVGQIDISNRFATLKTPYEERLTEVSYKNFTFRGLIHKNKTNNNVEIAFLHGTSKDSMLKLSRICFKLINGHTTLADMTFADPTFADDFCRSTFADTDTCRYDTCRSDICRSDFCRY